MLSKCISKTLPFLFMMVVPSLIFAQKKPLDHGVYDSWQSIGERKISANGLWVAYTIDAQEGDGKLIIQKTDSSYSIEIARGYSATFTEDGLYIAMKIKPLYADVRQAKIKKKKPEEFPKDSLGIYDLTLLSLEKIPGVLSFKLPENSSKWLAYQLSNKNVDSVKREAKKDSFKTVPDTGKAKIPLIIEQTPDKKQKRKMSAKSENDAEEDAEGDDGAKAPVQEGSELVVRNLSEKKETKIPLINEYYWSENGKILLLESSASKADKSIQPMVYIWRSVENRFDTIMKGGNDFKNFTIDKAGYQIAFVAERDSSFKSLQKFYKLWLWQNGDKVASVVADKYTVGMNINWTVNEYYTPNFSEKGKRLFLGTNPIKSIKDTSLIEMDLVKVDIWHYNDDYLQPYQLRTAEQESKRAYLGMIDLSTKKFTQLADLQLPQVVISNEGDGEQFLGMSDRGKRVSMQWEGGTRKDIYSIEPATAN